MINRLYQLTALFFFLFSGFSASGRGVSYHINHKDEKKAAFKTASPNHRPFNYEYSLNNVPLPVINVQQHRGAHSLQGFYYNPNFFSIGIKYTTLNCCRDTSQLSRFRKLILFPFHAFW